MSEGRERALAELERRFANWPVVADVKAERNPLIALLAYVELLDQASATADRYIQGVTNSTALPVWRGRGKPLPVKKFRRYTSDITAAISLYTSFPGGEMPSTIPSTPLDCTKDALRRLVEKAMAQ